MNFLNIDSLDDLIKEADINKSIKEDRINSLIELVDSFETTGRPIHTKGLIEDPNLFITRENIHLLRSVLSQLKRAGEEGIDPTTLILTLEESIGKKMIGEENLLRYLVGDPNSSVEDAIASLIASIQPSDESEEGGHIDKMKSTDGGSGIDGKNSWASVESAWKKIAVDIEKEEKEEESAAGKAKGTEEEVLKKIIDLFTNNPTPEDFDVHAFAEKEGINPHHFEEYVYSLLGAVLGKGKSNLEENKDKSFNKDQEEKGIEVEQEHVVGADLPQEILDTLAEKITHDHQVENTIADDEYYDRLIADEKEMEDKSKDDTSSKENSPEK
jgi:hypothetical protein